MHPAHLRSVALQEPGPDSRCGGRESVSDPWLEMTGYVKRVGLCPFNYSYGEGILTFLHYLQCARRRKGEITLCTCEHFGATSSRFPEIDKSLELCQTQC